MSSRAVQHTRCEYPLEIERRPRAPCRSVDSGHNPGHGVRGRCRMRVERRPGERLLGRQGRFVEWERIGK